jgi:hypothetical protein
MHREHKNVINSLYSSIKTAGEFGGYSEIELET